MAEISIPGYTDYKKREYCNKIQCPVQMELNRTETGSESYERIRKKCKEACVHTTHEFHAWLLAEGYLVVRPE